MSCSTFLRKLKEYFLRLLHKRKPPTISLLIPFSTKNKMRKRVLKWLIAYWQHELPEAEIIIGRCKSRVFCKGEALNDAMRKASGEIIVIIDSDAYLDGSVIKRCARRILEEKKYGNRLWYVPYRHLYRLTKYTTERIIYSNPKHPLRLSSPPPPCSYESNGHKSKYGHRYGAMCMMFPREAIEILGGFDERFKGWGGEDVALLRALDTLYAKHKTTKNDILHLWHPFIGENYKTRVWEGQTTANTNNRLANKYNEATGKPSKMRKLVDKGHHPKKK